MTPSEALLAQWWDEVDDPGLWGALSSDTVRDRLRAGDVGWPGPLRLVQHLAQAPVDQAGPDLELVAKLFDPHQLGAWLDLWWIETLFEHPGSRSADAHLAALAATGWDIDRWLRIWLVELDGPGASHLVDAVLADWSAPGWEQAPDQRLRAQTWARSDAVINGLTLVGGVHLEPGQLALALERMI